jgi:tape measure domain-containing protein
MAGNKKLEFLFKLIDKVSGPATKMEKSLRKLEAAMGDTGKASGKLSKGLSKITFVEKGAGRAGRAIRSARKETSGWSMTLQGIDSGLSIFGRVSSMALGTASAIAEIGVSTVGAIAKIQQFGLEAADFKERTLIGFKTFLGGDQKKAEDLFKEAMDFARKTPFETQDTVDMFRQLATGGFKFNKNNLGVSEIEVAAKAIGDLASVSGGGAEQINRITKAFAQIKSKGKLKSEELTGQLGDAGINISKVYEILGKNLGKTRDQVEKLMRAGKIDADTGIFAIIEAMKATTSGGKLGGPMDELSQTLTGLWSTIKSAPFDMLVDLDKTLGFKQAKGFFANMQKALDPTSGPGKRVKARLEKTFDDMFGFTFGGLSGSDGADQIATFMERAADIFEAGWKAVKNVTTKIIDETTSYLSELGGGDVGKGLKEFTDKIVSGVGNAAIGLAKLVPLMTTVLELIISAAEKVGLIDAKHVGESWLGDDDRTIAEAKKRGIDSSDFESQKAEGWMNSYDIVNSRTALQEQVNAAIDAETAIGKNPELAKRMFDQGYQLITAMGQGFQIGAQENRPLWESAGMAMQYAIDAAKNAGEIHSPSKVFEYFGLMTAKGFSDGVEAGQGTAEDKVRDLMAARGAAFDTSSGGTPSSSSAALSGRGVSIGNVSVIVQTGPQSDPQATAAAVAEVLPEALLEAIERLNMEAGI